MTDKEQITSLKSRCTSNLFIAAFYLGQAAQAVIKDSHIFIDAKLNSAEECIQNARETLVKIQNP